MRSELNSIVLGTAGHIDHGKSSLIRALTGIDTDRLKEEKQRGITIELGFAHLELPQTLIGIVDVPGHERFIKAMVAGAGGIDLALLVVAADEGIMPQTREHLDICSLLSVRAGLIALTKKDLVDQEWLDLVEQEVREAVKDTFLADAPIVPCSSQSGEGLDQLKDALAALAQTLPARAREGLFRLPLDRVFSMKGFGTVVTGTVLSGEIESGEPVEVLPTGAQATIRRLQLHGETVPRARAGQRTAINLAGVDRAEVARGEVVVRPGSICGSAMIDVELKLLRNMRRGLKGRSTVLFHLGTRQQEATCLLLEPRELLPGEQGLAQLRFETPVLALPGDRFILRGFAKQENHGTTIGGGRVVRVLAPKIRRGDQAAIELLHRMSRSDLEQRLVLEVLASGRGGLDEAQLQHRLPFSARQREPLIAQALSAGVLVRFDREAGGLIHAEPFEALCQQIARVVREHLARNPISPGISREELRSRLKPSPGARLFHVVLTRLAQGGQLVIDGETCRLLLAPDAGARQSVDDLLDRVLAHYRTAALSPPREAEAGPRLGLDNATLAKALRALCERGDLVRIGGLFFSRIAVDALEQALRLFLSHEQTIAPGQFKSLVGQSRKFSIPLAEYFDAQKVTLRVGELRRLR
jgi:selenocysteine-specific elongation factor